MLDVEGGRELVRESGSEDCAERQTGRQTDRHIAKFREGA